MSAPNEDNHLTVALDNVMHARKDEVLLSVDISAQKNNGQSADLSNNVVNVINDDKSLSAYKNNSSTEDNQLHLVSDTTETSYVMQAINESMPWSDCNGPHKKDGQFFIHQTVF